MYKLDNETLTRLKNSIVLMLSELADKNLISGFTVRTPDITVTGHEQIEPFATYILEGRRGKEFWIDPVWQDGEPALMFNDLSGSRSIFKIGKDLRGFDEAAAIIIRSITEVSG